MATRTSVGSGNWSSAGTWDTGVPIDGDDVVIASGHTVTFDADQSAFTTGVKITITGTLNHALSGGPYKLFLKAGAAAITGTGTWNVGTSALDEHWVNSIPSPTDDGAIWIHDPWDNSTIRLRDRYKKPIQQFSSYKRR